MSKIHLLDQNTINKIAAGEVVERPASIVKELVENSIDAGSTAITVEIKEGGISMIRITDNGIGIEPADIKSAFLRHSTSKISEIDDLLTVTSLGFRGEALASIASIAQVELITKTSENLTGIRYVIEGGIERLIEEIGCPEGTTFVIQNIFFNTPARKKFLKSVSTEGGYISELINKLALGNPQISFKFINNGQVKLYTTGNGRLQDCVFTVFNKDIAKNLINVDYKNNDFSVDGFIGKPVISRANRNYENYYINGRYIKSKVVQKAIEDAYKSKLTLHQYPFCVFDIKLLSEYVDVNVHPTKMDVRFNNESYIYESIYNVINRALNKTDLIPEVTFDKKINIETTKIINKSLPEPFEKNRIQEQNNIGYSNSYQIHEREIKDNGYSNQASENKLYENKFLAEKKYDIDNLVNNNIQADSINKTDNTSRIEKNKINEQKNDDNELYNEKRETAENINNTNNLDISDTSLDSNVIEKIIKGEQLNLKESLFTNPEIKKEHRVIGQLFNTYWIVEFKDKYYIIDQHAAHERILYERIINGLKDKIEFSQELLEPLVVQLSMKEHERFITHEKLFSDLGFAVEDFGGDSVAVRAVPHIFDRTLRAEDFIQILDRLDDEYKEEKYDILLEEIASMACKAAVKANDHMSLLEYQKLIDKLLELENPFNCPHGRPTIISMTKYELEKKFKRIQ